MGPSLVWIFLAAFGLLMGLAIVRRLLNPFSAVDYAELPPSLREEIARLFPGYLPQGAKRTKNRDEARLTGQWDGRRLAVLARFDAEGRLVEFDAEAGGSLRKLERTARESLPAPAAAEIDRVLGEPAPAFERSKVTRGQVGDEDHFEFKGYAEGWKWEIVVSARGRLHEVEREQRVH